MEKIIYKNEQGEEKEYDILVSFEKNDKKYVTYTAYEKDENDNIKCYSSVMNNDKLEPIEDESIYDNIEEILKTITEEAISKYKINKE